MNKRQIGNAYEQMAAEYLLAHGYEVKEKNFRCRLGEIDIVAQDGEYLCFVEVKFRSSEAYGNAFAAVDRRKQRVISQVAQYYLMTHGYGEWSSCRFDVVAFDGGQVQLLKNAFEAYF